MQISKTRRLLIMLEATPGVVSRDMIRHFGVDEPRYYVCLLRKQGFEIEKVGTLGYRLVRPSGLTSSQFHLLSDKQPQRDDLCPANPS